MKRDLIQRPMCKCDRRRNSCMILAHTLLWYANSISKETCIYEKRHDKETNEYDMYDICNRRRS